MAAITSDGDDAARPSGFAPRVYSEPRTPTVGSWKKMKVPVLSWMVCKASSRGGTDPLYSLQLRQPYDDAKYAIMPYPIQPHPTPPNSIPPKPTRPIQPGPIQSHLTPSHPVQ